VRDAEAAGKRLATSVGFDASRGVTELTVFAPDHPWLLSIIAGACALAGANIVDAQIYTTTDGLALDTISVTREFEREEDEARRAARIGDAIEKAVRGEIKLPDVVAKRAPPKGRLKAFAIEPEVTINNQWSNRYTVVEVTGLDRPGPALRADHDAVQAQPQHRLGPCRDLRRTRRRRVLRHRSARRQITTPTRQAAIKRPLLALFTARALSRKTTRGSFPPLSMRASGNPPLNRALYRRFSAFSAPGTGHGVATGRGNRKRAHSGAACLDLAAAPAGPHRRLLPQPRRIRPPSARQRHDLRSAPSKRRGGGKAPFPASAGLIYWGAVLALWAIIAAIGVLVWIGIHLPPIQSLEIPKRPPSVLILGANGATLATRGDMGGAEVPLRDLPDYVPKAFIAIEDRRFYSHHGVDPFGILRAAIADVLHRGASQGGSTLTQQLAKNLFLTQERTVTRKLQEVVLALWLEHKFSKAQILELYLNRVYFGSGAYGIEARRAALLRQIGAAIDLA
jgi:hypothetical protein